MSYRTFSLWSGATAHFDEVKAVSDLTGSSKNIAQVAQYGRAISEVQAASAGMRGVGAALRSGGLGLGAAGVAIDAYSTYGQFNQQWATGDTLGAGLAGAGTGQITQQNQVVFTDWDPTAATDMQALADVFDANHNGKLDAGDANFNAFKILVTNADGATTLKTLAQAGVASINLTADALEDRAAGRLDQWKDAWSQDQMKATVSVHVPIMIGLGNNGI